MHFCSFSDHQPHLLSRPQESHKIKLKINDFVFPLVFPLSMQPMVNLKKFPSESRLSTSRVEFTKSKQNRFAFEKNQTFLTLSRDLHRLLTFKKVQLRDKTLQLVSKMEKSYENELAFVGIRFCQASSWNKLKIVL